MDPGYHFFLRQEKKTISFPPARFNPSHGKVSEILKKVFYLAPDRINERNVEVWGIDEEKREVSSCEEGGG